MSPERAAKTAVSAPELTPPGLALSAVSASWTTFPPALEVPPLRNTFSPEAMPSSFCTDNILYGRFHDTTLIR